MNEIPIIKPNLSTAHLLGEHSFNHFEQSLNKTINYLQDFLKKDKFFSGESMNYLLGLKEQIAIGDSPISINEALKEIKEIYLDQTISFHHSNYIAHLNCPILLPAIVGDLIATTVNTAIETWDQSTTATYIEQEMIRWISNKFHFPSTSDGIFTSGGTQSNLMAVLMARDHYAHKNYGINIKQNGSSEVVQKFRIFCSEKAHFSLKKSAGLLGMGYNAIIPVSVDDQMRMNPNALAFEIEKEKQLGNIPIAIVATLGTTDFGSFDPLSTISKIAKESNCWLHIDAAYGGCFVLTDTHRHLFKGSEYADSITVDFHKTLFQPVCSSAFLLKNQQNFRYVSYYADYLNPIENNKQDQPNLVEKSLQTTRRFDALKLWFTLKVTGENQLKEYLEQVHFSTRFCFNKMKDDPYFELAHTPELSTLVFRYIHPGINENIIHDKINLFIKNALFNAGKASIASTKIDSVLFLKFTILNPSSTEFQLNQIIDLIKSKGAEYKYNN